MSETLALVDLSAIFWRYWHVSESKEFSTARNDTVRLVESLVVDHDYAIVCIDVPPYKRSEIYPEYKAGRERKPIAVQELKEVIKELKSHFVPCKFAIGYEADDIIATLSLQAKSINPSPAITVYGCDKDLLQIEGVKIVDPLTKVEITSFDKFGVPPELVHDILALSGDKADNIPGVERIGAKTAVSIVNMFSVDEFLTGNYKKSDFESLPDSIKKNLVECYDDLFLSNKLVSLYYDAPVVLDLEKAKKQPEEAGKVMSEKIAEEPKEVSDNIVVEPVQREQVTKNELIKSDERNGKWSLALEPETMSSAIQLAKMLHDSRLFGQFQNPESVLAIVLRGRSLGIDAVTALSSFHVIKGKPTMHASLMVGLVLQSKLAEYFDLVESDEEKATWATKRINSKREVSLSFTIKDAESAKLLNGGNDSGWFKYRKVMLRWRSATELSRAVYPDVVTGIYTPDEIDENYIVTQ